MSEKKSLYQIAAENLEILSQIWGNGGEITEEIETALVARELELEDKVDRYCGLINTFKKERAHIKERIEELSRISQSLSNQETRLKEMLDQTCVALNMDELSGSEYRVKRVLSPARVVIADETVLPDDFFKISKSPDKTRIKDALKAGESVEGCSLERGHSVRLSPARR